MFVAAVALQLLLAGCVGAQEAGEYIITTVAGGMSGELVANATKINEPSGVADGPRRQRVFCCRLSHMASQRHHGANVQGG